MNDRGQVVAAAPSEQRELFWDQGQTQVIECFCAMAALGMNRQGAVVGWHASLWQHGVTTVLDGAFGTIAINDRGVVVGTAHFQQPFPLVPAIWLPLRDSEYEVQDSEGEVQESARRGGDSNPR